MIRALAVAAAVLAAAGCSRKEPEAAAGPASTVIEWAQQSPDGRFEVRLRRDMGGCHVQAVVKPGDRVLWTSQACLPTPSGLVFLSANGEKLLVLDLFPSSAAAQGPDWTNLPLAAVWSRGAVVRQYTGGEILAPERAADMRRALSWVRGDSFEEAQRSARASADGDHVVVDLADGRTLTLGFDGAPLPTPALPAKAAAAPRSAAEPLPQRPASPAAAPSGGEAAPDPMASDERGLYRWEDEQGELHFGAGSQIPARLRKRAVPVSASVGVMPLDHTPAPPPPPPPPPAPPAAPAGAAPAGAAPAGSPGQAPAVPAGEQGAPGRANDRIIPAPPAREPT
jgi:hypothetical protein